MQNGKGSKPRPYSNFESFQSNWDTINWSKNEDKNTFHIENTVKPSILDETRVYEKDSLQNIKKNN
jgi:hypothetical protein